MHFFSSSLPPSSRTTAFGKHIAAITAALLAVWIIANRSGWITAMQYPDSTDGFFYLQEFKARYTTGKPYYLPYSAYFSLIVLLGKIFSLTPEGSYDLSVFLSLALLSIGLVISFRHRKDVWLAPCLIFSAWYSDILFFRYYAFPRQALAMSCLVTGIGLLNGWLAEGRKFRITAGVLLLAGAAFHVFVAALTAGILIVSGESLIRSRRVRWAAIFAAVLLALFYLALHPKQLSGYLSWNAIPPVATPLLLALRAGRVVFLLTRNCMSWRINPVWPLFAPPSYLPFLRNRYESTDLGRSIRSDRESE